MSTRILDEEDIGILVSKQGTNLVVVNSLSDLPAPVAGVITLVDNKTYLFQGVVNIGTNRIALGVSNTIIGIDKSSDGVLYTGTSSLFTGVDQDFSLRDCLVSAPVAGSTVFNLTGTIIKRLEIAGVIFGGCRDLGTITGYDLFVLRNSLISLSYLGLKLGSINEVIIVDNVIEHDNLNDPSCIWFDFLTGSTYDEIITSRNFFNLQSNEVAYRQGTITLNRLGKLFDNTFAASGTSILGGIETDNRWELTNNSGIIDSAPNGVIGFVDNITTTSVTTAWTVINATWLLNSGLKFTMPSNGILRYTGKQPGLIKLIAVLSASGASSYTAEISVYKNGALLTASKMDFSVYTSPEVNVFQVTDTAVENDEYQLRIRRNSGTAITTTVQNASLSAFKI